MAVKKKKVTSKKSVKQTKVSGGAKSSSKKLLRSRDDKMIAGVLGGLSTYMGIDSTILRLVWIAIVAFTGFVPGILAYGLAALVMPEK